VHNFFDNFDSNVDVLCFVNTEKLTFKMGNFRHDVRNAMPCGYAAQPVASSAQSINIMNINMA